jgi:hypothetical protein
MSLAPDLTIEAGPEHRSTEHKTRPCECETLHESTHCLEKTWRQEGRALITIVRQRRLLFDGQNRNGKQGRGGV